MEFVISNSTRSGAAKRAAEAFSDPIFRLLVESVRDYAIFMLTPEGRVATWNGGAERIKGYKAGEIIGEHFSKFYPADAIDRKWPDYELEVARKQGRFEDEGWRVRKDGTQFWANVVITAVYDEDGHLLGFAKVTRDLTERNNVLAMQTSQQHMDEFLALLGHELRNPLGAISNATSVVKKMANTGGPLQAAAGVLDRQTRQMSRIVDDLLDVARIRQGKFVIRKAPLDIRHAVQAAVDSVPLVQEKSHHLVVSLPEQPVMLEGDDDRLTQAFVNIINNSAKYTDAHGELSIAVERRGHEVVLMFKDNGKGIEPELLPNVFDSFRQGERTLHNAHGGLGLGLTLVQRIVNLHGGTIQAFSRGHNQGSEFIVRLPLMD